MRTDLTQLGIRVEVASDLSAVLGRPEWEQLAAEAAEKLPMMLSGFMMPWFAHAEPDYRCHALTAWRAGKLVGFAPFATRSVGRFGINYRIVGFPMRGTSPPFDILTGGQDDEVANAFVDHLVRVDKWDMMYLHNVRTPSSATDALCHAARLSGLDVRRTTCAETYYVEMDNSWDDFLRNRPRNIRKNISRGWRNCEKIGATKCVTYPGDISDLDDALERMLRLLRTSWKDIADVRSLDDHFLGLVARALDSNQRLRLRFLTINETPVAYLMEIHCRNDWYLFHSAFDPEYQRLSVGQLILGDCIRAAHDAHIATVDFLGTSDYLARWTDKTRAVDEITILRTSITSRLKSRIYQRVRATRHAAAQAATTERKIEHNRAKAD